MTEEEERKYEEQINDLTNRLNIRNAEIASLKEKMDSGNYEDLDKCFERLDKLARESKMDRELKDDLLNMLEVEDFLLNGPGRSFDEKYN